jgi:ABC-type antimicrobial peptide transport system permease subunit
VHLDLRRSAFDLAEIVGRKVVIHGYPLEIVGVARAGFSGVGESPLDLWLPLSMFSQVAGGRNVFDPSSTETVQVIARLKPGMTESGARELLNVLAPRLAQGMKGRAAESSIALQSNATSIHISRQAVTTLIPVIAAFALVLVMACANVANMMLARAVARQREIGIRLSLGAARTFRIKHNKTKETRTFQVAHGTLIIMAGTVQHFWKHEIPKTKEDVGERINLTFRKIMEAK